MIRVAISGACGRMGAHLIRAVEAHPETVLAGAIDAPDHPRLGETIAPGIPVVGDPDSALGGADVVIDFSVPAATAALLPIAASRKLAAVVGTTGLSDAQRGALENAARAVPVVAAANFSLGVNVLLELVDAAAGRLSDYDAELVEMHHAAKVDAPSGTALRLAEAVARARGVGLKERQVLHREGQTGPRPPGAIGIQTLRGGDTVGEHTVYLVGPGERLELTHRALSRDNFASGAVRAARWAVGREPGLYSMRDVLTRP